MKRLLVKKERARAARAEGKSIPEIAKELNVAKSTVSFWVRDVELSAKLRRQLDKNSLDGRQKGREMIRMNKELEQEYVRKEATRLVERCFKQRDSFSWQLLAAMLFWCEGQKELTGGIKFANSDPKLVQVFLSSLRKGFEIKEQKFRALIHLHDYHNVKTQTKFWSKVTEIPIDQFQTPYRKPHTGVRKRENYPGCISIRYYDTSLARRLTALYHAFGELL